MCDQAGLQGWRRSVHVLGAMHTRRLMWKGRICRYRENTSQVVGQAGNAGVVCREETCQHGERE